MKNKFLWIALLPFILFPSIVKPEGIVLDPTKISERTLTCILPTEYTDNSPLIPSDIIAIDFYRATTRNGPWELIYSQMDGGCRYVENILILAEGQYYYYATVTDLNGNTSDMSNIVPMEVRRLPPPKPVVLGWE